MNQFVTDYKEYLKENSQPLETFNEYLAEEANPNEIISKDVHIKRRYHDEEGKEVSNILQILQGNSIMIKGDAGMGKSK